MWYKCSEKEMCTEIFSTAAISIYWDILPVCGNFLMLIFQFEVALDNLLEYLKRISKLNSKWNFSHRASYQNPFSVSTAFNAICRKSSAAASHTTDTVRMERTRILRRQTLCLHGQVQRAASLLCPQCSLAGHTRIITQEPRGPISAALCPQKEGFISWDKKLRQSYREVSGLAVAWLEAVHATSKGNVVCLRSSV